MNCEMKPMWTDGEHANLHATSWGIEPPSVTINNTLSFIKSVSPCEVPRNYDPHLHPFEVSREYTRALNATKLDRMFAKPFVASMDGHRDGISCIAKHAKSLSTVISGACDGEVSPWIPLLFFSSKRSARSS